MAVVIITAKLIPCILIASKLKTKVIDQSVNAALRCESPQASKR